MRPWALGASWSELEPREALGGLGPWEQAGVNWSLGRPWEASGLGSELERGASHLVKLSLPDIC